MANFTIIIYFIIRAHHYHKVDQRYGFPFQLRFDNQRPKETLRDRMG